MSDEGKKKEIVNVVLVIAEVGRAIRDLTAASGGIPNGHLWARLMGHMEFADYNRCIKILKECELIVEKNYWLKWIGPLDQVTSPQPIKRCSDCIHYSINKPNRKLQFDDALHSAWCNENNMGTNANLLRCGGDDYKAKP